MAFLEKIKKNFNKHVQLAHANTNPNPNHTPDETAASATTEHYSTFVKRLSTNISKTNFAEIVLTQIPG
jgi:hypothetical protein